MSRRVTRALTSDRAMLCHLELCLSERSFIILSYVQDRAGNSCARLVLSRLW